MSESLTGVTFLAFGNGSPDVFSTFAAMSSNSGSLAVGELMGAAGFITAVVAGSMALVAPFQVARKSFIRDVGFFAVAASFSLVFLADGSLRLWECAAMVGFYIFYVIFVVTWHWWLTRRRRKKLAETTARLQHHIPDTQELEVPEIDDDEESRPASERTNLLRTQSGGSIPTIRTPATPAWKLEDLEEDDETRDRYLAELQSKMRIGRPVRGERRNTLTPIRPSLIGALEFRSLMTSLERKGTGGSTQPIGLRRYSEETLSGTGAPPLSAPPEASHARLDQGSYLDIDSSALVHGARERAVSANDASKLRIDTDFLSDRVSESAVSIRSASQTSSGQSVRPSAAILQTLNEPSSQRPPSPKLVVSASTSSKGLTTTTPPPGPPKSPNFLAPPSTMFRRPDYTEEHQQDDRSPIYSPRAGPTLQVPILHTPHPNHKRSAIQSEEFPAFTDTPMLLTPMSSRPPSIHLPEPSASPQSTRHLGLLTEDDEEDNMRRFAWWPYKYLPAPQEMVAKLFPTIYGWREKSILDRALGVVTAPSIFLLTITLPVVEPRADDAAEPDPELVTPSAPRSRTHSRIELPPDTPPLAPKSSSFDGTSIQGHITDYQDNVKTNHAEISGPKGWNRWLVFLQVFTAPLFMVSIFWANMDDGYGIKVYIRMVLGSLIFSLVLVLVLLSLTSADREPKYRPLFCFLGFAVAVGWIATIANEVVGVLKAFGVILGISDAILGLTIFAVGNSLGDLVADITVAKLGYPVMALSACFGGPMLNILLGIGIGGMYMTIHNATHKHAQHPHKPIKYKPYQLDVSTTLMISGVTLLVTLVGLLVVVPLNGWRMDRKIGLGLILLWALSTVGNVGVEILGYGGDTV